MGVIDRLTDLIAWWRWELGRLPLVRRGRDRPDAFAYVRRDGIFVGPTDGSERDAVPVDSVAGVPEILGRDFRRGRLGRPGVELVLGPGRHLARRLSPMRLPKSRQKAMARLDLRTATPFREEDVHAVIPSYSADDPGAGYYIVKKEHVAPVLAELRAAGVRVAGVLLSDDGRIIRPDREATDRMLGAGSRGRLLGRATRIGMALAVVGVAATYGVVQWRYARSIGDLDGALVVAQRQVGQLRAMIDARNRKVAQLMAARDSKRTAVPLSRILEEMARAIPNTTWLTEIEMRGGDVTFSGFSSSAASLIPLLDASPLFASPTFRDPVVRVPNQTGERFTIGMEIEAPNG